MKLSVAMSVILLGVFAVSQQQSAVKAWDAASIVWREVNPDGSKYSALEGDKNGSGEEFTYAASCTIPL